MYKRQQYIEEHGNGGSIIAKDNYFFIDNSFVRCMYEYGAIVFVLVIVLIFMAQKKMLDNEKYIMCLAFFIVTIASFAEHHLLEIAYNPFIFSVFACMSNNDKVIMEEKRIVIFSELPVRSMKQTAGSDWKKEFFPGMDLQY